MSMHASAAVARWMLLLSLSHPGSLVAQTRRALQSFPGSHLVPSGKHAAPGVWLGPQGGTPG